MKKGMRQPQEPSLFRRQNPLQHQKHRQRQKLTGNERHILEAGEETTAVLAGHFAEIGCARAIFTANADALQKPCENQNGRRGNADRLMAGRNRDQQRTETHQRDGQGETGLAALAVGIGAHEPGPDGPHQKSDGENGGRAQKFGGLVSGREKHRREIKGEGRVDIPVVPFDEVARRSADNGFQTGFLVRRGGGTICHNIHG